MAVRINREIIYLEHLSSNYLDLRAAFPQQGCRARDAKALELLAY